MPVEAHSELAPWTVALISTDKDLHDLRSDLYSGLRTAGFAVSAFEKSDFPVEPGMNTFEACLVALQRADIVVTVIDKRYGALYMGTGPYSITEAEYQKAMTEQRIVIPCIRKEAWAEYQHYKAAIESFGSARTKKQFKTHYVDGVSVLEFIERVQKADRDSYITFYDSSQDLLPSLLARLSGLYRWLCQQIVSEQINTVRDKKTTTGLATMSLGEVIEKGFVVEPPFRLDTGSVADDCSLTDILSQIQNHNQDLGIWIVGDAGCGKSTILARAFLDHARRACEEHSYRLPFYVSLRGRGSRYHFSFLEYIDDCCREHLHKVPFPNLQLTHIKPVFYIDGLDELGDASQLDVHGMAMSKFFTSPFVAVCRARFADAYLNEESFSNRVSVGIRLLHWDANSAVTYTKRFCEVRKHHGMLSSVLETLGNSIEIQDIASSPLLMTMFLWLIEQSGMQLPLGVTDRVTLYTVVLGWMAKREAARLHRQGGPNGKKIEETLLRVWQRAAWMIYVARHREERLQLPEILSSVRTALPMAEFLGERLGLDVILDLRRMTDEVVGMLHEQFLEHLVAREIHRSMLSGGSPYPELLKLVIRPEINHVLRSMWSATDPNDLRAILSTLWQTYHTNLLDNQPWSAAVRMQACYYIGRLPIPEADETLRRTLATERNMGVRLTVAIGLILRGDLAVEKGIYNEMLRDQSLDSANRGAHLVYYADRPSTNGGPPYCDPGTVDWTRSLHALKRQIVNPQGLYRWLRRLDLFTIRRFMETRGAVGAMTADIIDELRRAISVDQLDPSDYNRSVLAELERLMQTWESLRGKA